MPSNHPYTIIAGMSTGSPFNKLEKKEAAQLTILRSQSRLAKAEKKWGTDSAMAQANFKKFVTSLYSRNGIDSRFLAKAPGDEDLPDAPIEQRFQWFRHYAAKILPEMAKVALEDAGMSPTQIDNVILATNTGFCRPHLESALYTKLGLKHTAPFTHLMGMGCGGGAAGLRTAHEYCRGHPGSKVLLMVIDLSSVHATYNVEKLDLILHSIFADGCAAIVLHSSPTVVPGKFCIEDGWSELLENADKGIELLMDSQSVKCILAKSLPDHLQAQLGAAVARGLLRKEMTVDDIKHWAVHPGGRKILDSSQIALNLKREQLNDSWEVLAENGNMLAPSVLYVIRKMMARLEKDQKGAVSETGLALAFSPGVRVEGILFRYTPSYLSNEIQHAESSSSFNPLSIIMVFLGILLMWTMNAQKVTGEIDLLTKVLFVTTVCMAVYIMLGNPSRRAMDFFSNLK